MSGLLRGVARTAVISGTATAVSNNVSRRQANRWAQQQQAQPAYMAPIEPQQSAPAAAPASGGVPIEQLKELAQLHQQGILTDEEFAAQKARLLA